MNYYPFHIGDYAKHTRNLSLLEDLAYRRLIDAYYLGEQPLNGSAAEVAREIGMRDHLVEVEYVLSKFFVADGGAWRNARADEEITKFHAKAEWASRAGKASAERRRNARSAPVAKTSTDVEESATDVPPTKNQEPRTNTSSELRPEEGERGKRAAPPPTKPEDVSDQVWKDWLQLRKLKKAPVTATVLDGARREAEKAAMPLQDFLEIWCLRGTQGLQADWLKPHELRGRQGKTGYVHDLSQMDYTKGVGDDGRF